MSKQVFKKGAIEFIKTTKGILNKLYKISDFYNNQSFYIYNGFLLNTDCFNIQYSLVNLKVSTSNLKNNEVYVITEMDNKNNIFNLKKS
jgi:hypothetical protein